MSVSSKDGVYRLTKPPMPPWPESQTALPSYAAGAIGAADRARKRSAGPHLHPLQKADEADCGRAPH